MCARLVVTHTHTAVAGRLTARHPLAALTRRSQLAIAHARLSFHDAVLVPDALVAIRILEETIRARTGHTLLATHEAMRTYGETVDDVRRGPPCRGRFIRRHAQAGADTHAALAARHTDAGTSAPMRARTRAYTDGRADARFPPTHRSALPRRHAGSGASGRRYIIMNRHSVRAPRTRWRQSLGFARRPSSPAPGHSRWLGRPLLQQ